MAGDKAVKILNCILEARIIGVDETGRDGILGFLGGVLITSPEAIRCCAAYVCGLRWCGCLFRMTKSGHLGDRRDIVGMTCHTRRVRGHTAVIAAASGVSSDV